MCTNLLLCTLSIGTFLIAPIDCHVNVLWALFLVIAGAVLNVTAFS